MTELRAQGVALVVLLLALPVLAVGVNADLTVLAVVGVVMVAAAALLLPALRWLDLDDEEDS